MHKLFLTAMLLSFFSITNAQNNENSDFAEIDSVITTLYKVISGPAGERNWNLFKSLFHEKATMGAIRISKEGTRNFSYFDVDGYVERNGPFFKDNGFYEEELGREVKIFGGVAQVFTSYQFRLNDDIKIVQRGINCIQLVFDVNRWYITNIVWEAETVNNKIPKLLSNN